MSLKKTMLVLLAIVAVAAGAEEPSERSTVEPALSAEFGGPLRLSANLGVRVPLGAAGYGRGLLLQVQPGLGGGAVNVGFVPVSFYGDGMQLIAVGVKARLLRTWGSPLGTEPGRSYAGFEAGVSVGVKVTVGMLWKLNSGTGDDRILTWSIGLGF